MDQLCTLQLSPRFTSSDKEASESSQDSFGGNGAENLEKLRHELHSARSMAFDFKAMTPQSQALGDEVRATVESWERDHGKRRRRRQPKAQESFELTVSRFVADLVMNASDDRLRWGYCVQSPSAFVESEANYQPFKATRDAMMELGLLERRNGYSSPGFGSKQDGKAARLRATDKFFSLTASVGVYPEDAYRHFQRRLPQFPLQLRSASHIDEIGRKIDGKRMKFAKTHKTAALERDLHDLNKFLDQFTLENGIHRGYRRIFNEGDHPDFNWNKGGRLYSQGEDSYQRMKSEDRLKMRINGEPVCEIDIRASYLTMLYALAGSPLPSDATPYEIDGIPRKIIKAWITITLGHDKLHVKWPSELKADLEGKGFDLTNEFKIKAVQEAVLDRHPILRDWPSMPFSWADLMYMESAAVMNTSLYLTGFDEVPCFSVHDSIIVPESQAQLAAEALSLEYRRSTGAKPTLVGEVAQSPRFVFDIVETPGQTLMGGLIRS